MFKTLDGGIETLSFKEIFVFGSNFERHHNGGAAKTALNKFGAIYGHGVNLQGQSYSIPTFHNAGLFGGFYGPAFCLHTR